MFQVSLFISMLSDADINFADIKYITLTPGYI